MLQNFRSYRLAIEFHKSCRSLKLPYYLKDQINRASSSVALNLAEGAAKTSLKEQKRFYGIALASLRECQAVLDLSECATNESDKLSALDKSSELGKLSKQVDCLGAHIFKLIESCNRRQ